MTPAGFRLPESRSAMPARLGRCLPVGGLSLPILMLATLAAAATPPAPFTRPAGQESYQLTITEAAPPDGITAAIAEHVQGKSLNVLTAGGEPIMDIWFARELPAPTDPDPHPGIAFGTLNEGVVLAVMRLHREHHDYRDQPVGPGVYVARYLRQPDDGNHLGETTYRDFAVLVRPSTDSPAPQGFQETLDQALELNLHPFAWGLWPQDQVPGEVPGIASFQPDKWAVKINLARADGSSLPIAFVVAGNEWHY